MGCVAGRTVTHGRVREGEYLETLRLDTVKLAGVCEPEDAVLEHRPDATPLLLSLPDRHTSSGRERTIAVECTENALHCSCDVSPIQSLIRS